MYPITKEELLDIINKLPNNKSPGPDGIPYEVYKYHSNIFSPILLSLFNYCLSQCLICPGSDLAIIITLFKKGDIHSLKNWRPISL